MKANNQEEILKRVEADLSFLKQKIISIELGVEEVNEDIHREVRPAYLKKLNKIEKQKPIKFKNMKELVEFFSK